MKYNYYLQIDKTQGIRRYVEGQDQGERWDRERQQWSKECADRRSCELTGDRELNEVETQALL